MTRLANETKEIYSLPFEKVYNLAVMLGIPEETLEEIVDNIPGSGDDFGRNFAVNALDSIVEKLEELGYDGDCTYDNVYWFDKKEDDDYFSKFDRKDFKVNEPLNKCSR